MTAVSAHVVLKTRDCVTRGCVEAAVKGLATCRRHAPVAELRRLREEQEAASGVVQAIRLRVEPLPEDHDGVWKTSDQRERQAWRGIAHYLEGTIKAATFVLIRFEDIFLSFMELEPMGRTLGETVIPQIARGRLELLPGQVEVT
jgi:hypothetical protein